MDKSKRMNTLLVEILIVLFFFMLASTVLMDVFAHARQLSATAQARSTALEEAQNVAEQLYAADDAHEPLQEMGFDVQDGTWLADRGEYVISVTVTETFTEGGVLRRMDVTAQREGEELFTLPCSRYREVPAHE